MFRRFLVRVWIVTFVLAGVVAAWNLFMDPFDIYNPVSIPGVNNVRVALETNARMAKPIKADRYNPNALILGSSTAEVGLNPEHPGWGEGHVFNMAIAGGNMMEARRYFDHLVEREDIDRVVLQFDFLMAHGTNSTDERSFVWSGMLIDPFSVGRRVLQTVFSTYATMASYEGLIRSMDSIRRDDDASYLRNGQRGWRYYEYRMGRGVAYQFENTEREYATGALFAGGVFRFSYPNALQAQSPFDHLRHVITQCYRRGIDLKIVMPPSHARYLVMLRAVGLWPALEVYKAKVVEIVQDEAEAAGSSPFEVWDFTAVSDTTSEPVPPGADGRMMGYWDTVHYKNAIGDMVLDRLFGQSSESAGFGVLLSGAALGSVLSLQRDALDAYERNNPQDAGTVLGMVTQTEGLRSTIDLMIP